MKDAKGDRKRGKKWEAKTNWQRCNLQIQEGAAGRYVWNMSSPEIEMTKMCMRGANPLQQDEGVHGANPVQPEVEMCMRGASM
jgi:hypothetical protein